jgi:6-phosphofructokinase 1
MKTIGVLTSGGDAPGMNAAIRSVVRSAIYKGLQVKGIMRGFRGLIHGEVKDLDARSVSNILSRGGTVLKTTRSEEFMTREGRKKAAETVKRHNIDALVIIGGNGSFKGAQVLWEEHKIRSVGIPGTIDNDISGSDYTVGAYTAVNTALDAIDKIRDTVTSMERIYVIEVMGRKDPFIATRVGLAGGAEDVIFSHTGASIDQMCKDIIEGRQKGKFSWIIIVSEGYGKASEIANTIREKTHLTVRPVILGYIQRGGAPEAFDRILASILGYHAVEALLNGDTNCMVGLVSHEVEITPYAEAIKKDLTKKECDERFYNITKILAI